MEKIITICDICKDETDTINSPIQVIFTTEKTEGRACDPYFEIIKIDICNKCSIQRINGETVLASGAMGHNSYRFKTPSRKELQHFKESSMGLWCIDKNPNTVSLKWIKQNAFQLN